MNGLKNISQPSSCFRGKTLVMLVLGVLLSLGLPLIAFPAFAQSPVLATYPAQASTNAATLNAIVDTNGASASVYFPAILNLGI